MNTNYKNIRVNNLYESIIKSGYPMRTGEPIELPTDKEEVKKIALEGLRRGKKLGNAPSGSGHSNFLKGINVAFDMKITQALLPQFERYHWLEIVSSQSKMHRITKGDFDYHPYVTEEAIDNLDSLLYKYNNFDAFKGDDDKIYLVEFDSEYTKSEMFEVVVYNCPLGLQLWMAVDTNYLQLQTVVNQRKTHKMSEWKEFADMCSSLELFEELCLNQK